LKMVLYGAWHKILVIKHDLSFSSCKLGWKYPIVQ